MISKGIDVCFDDWENAAQWTGERGWKKRKSISATQIVPPLSWVLPLLFFSPKIIFFPPLQSSLHFLAIVFLFWSLHISPNISIELRIVWHQEKRGILPRNPCATFILLLFYGITNGQRNKYIAPDWLIFLQRNKMVCVISNDYIKSSLTPCTFWRYDSSPSHYIFQR